MDSIRMVENPEMTILKKYKIGNNEMDDSITSKYNDINSSGENIQLSLEVEIADSLKNIMNTEMTKSSLLDVTIISPGDTPDKPITETNILKEKDVKELLASIQRKRQNPPSPQQVIGKLHPSKPERNNNENIFSLKKICGYKNIHYHNFSKNSMGNRTQNNQDRKKSHFTKYSHNASVDIMKPLLGNIRESLRNVETKILEIGDNNYKQTYENYYSDTLSYSSNTVGDHLNKHQVYATVRTFEDLKKRLKCQKNPNGDDDEKSDKPCLCQHCGMVGLLIDSQKRPMIPSPSKQALPDHDNRSKSNYSNNSKYNRRVIKKTSSTVLHDLSARIKNLEKRMNHQEQNSIPKDYFKRIIQKIITMCERKKTVNFITTKSESTQCVLDETSKKKAESKYANKHLFISPMFSKRKKKLESDLKSSKHASNQNLLSPTNVTLDSEHLLADTENLPTMSDASKHSSKNGNYYWRWGEETIKPGMDLKRKIVGLLEETVHKFMGLKESTKHEKQSDKSVMTATYQVNSKIQTENFNKNKSATFESICIQTSDINIDSKSKTGKTQAHNSVKIDQIFPRKTNLSRNNSSLLKYKTANKRLNIFEPLKFPVDIKNSSCSVLSDNDFPPNDNDQIPAEKGNKISRFRKSMIPKLKSNKTQDFNKHDAYNYTAIEKLNQQSRELNVSSSFSTLPVTISEEIQVSRSKSETHKNDLYVKYINPHMYFWKDSVSSMKTPSIYQQHTIHYDKNTCDVENKNKPLVHTVSKESLPEKIKLLKFLAKRKDIDKKKLWNQIWVQAQNYKKLNQDKISIKVPINHHGKLEYVELNFNSDDIEALTSRDVSKTKFTSKSSNANKSYFKRFQKHFHFHNAR